MIADFSLAFFLQPVLADIGLSLLQLLLFFVSLWLIFLILIQRGKGGGLTAAFGGGGGDSAFGAKAGDAFTKITIVSALVWITLCMVTIARYNPPEQAVNPFAQAEQEAPLNLAPSMGAVSSEEAGDADSSGEGGAAEGDSSDTTSDAEAAGSDSADSESADGGSDQ